MPTPNAVGLEFLRAREAGERDLGFRQRQRPGFRIAQHVLDDAIHQRDLARLVLADRGWAPITCDILCESTERARRCRSQRDQSRVT